MIGVHVIGEQPTELVHVGLIAFIVRFEHRRCDEACFNILDALYRHAGCYNCQRIRFSRRAAYRRPLIAETLAGSQKPLQVGSFEEIGDMIKLKHLLHPLRTAQIARSRVTAHLNMRRFALHSARHFEGDSRYDLQNVTEGFKSRIDSLRDDREPLERICAAYAKSIADERFVSPCYHATEWWKQHRQSCLRPVTQALQSGDIDGLRTMYRNLFRDRCTTGLVATPYGMPQSYFRGPIKDTFRRSYMGDALYRLDYWASQTGGRFELSDLADPGIGNPFGASIKGTLVRTGAEYQHYCAQRILSQSSADHRVVAEIGGGYGGTAYYLLRDGGNLTYVDFDVPESIALTSYYLLNAFPSSKVFLYGEQQLTDGSIAASDIVLMPLHEMAKLPSASVGVVFSSHAMSDLSHSAMVEYLKAITHMTSGTFLYIGHDSGAKAISTLMRARYDHVDLLETRPSYWNLHRAPTAKEVECVYRINHT